MSTGADVDFVYTPSLQNYPDLPPWIHYKFNSKHSHGYLYGTAPMNLLERQIIVNNLIDYKVLKDFGLKCNLSLIN